MADPNVRWVVVTDARTLTGLEHVLPDYAKIFDIADFDDVDDRGRHTLHALIVVAVLNVARGKADDLAASLASERLHASVHATYAEAHGAWLS